MMAVEFFDHKLGSPIVARGAASLAEKADADAPHLSGASAPSILSLFPAMATTITSGTICTMAMFQVGAEPWKRELDKRMRLAILKPASRGQTKKLWCAG